MQSNELNSKNPNAPLVRVEQKDGRQVVSARELYSFLEVKTDFSDWCKRMFDYGFTENQDYTKVFPKNEENPKGGRPSVDYALTLDCAKQIAMLQRNDKGRQARQYFIECEKNLLEGKRLSGAYLQKLRTQHEKLTFFFDKLSQIHFELGEIIGNDGMDSVSTLGYTLGFNYETGTYTDVNVDSSSPIQDDSSHPNKEEYETVDSYFRRNDIILTNSEIAAMNANSRYVSKRRGVMVGSFGHQTILFRQDVLSVVLQNYQQANKKVVKISRYEATGGAKNGKL